MIRLVKILRLLVVAAVLVFIGTTGQSAQGQVSNKQVMPVTLMYPVKISFNITPNPSYFWSAALTEDGNLSWTGLPGMITIRVGIGGPVYSILEGTSMPFTINTGEVKFAAGSQVIVAVQVLSKKGSNVANKLYAVPVNNSVFNITMQGPAQLLLYKPVFNP
jgi:hypothetical protein